MPESRDRKADRLLGQWPCPECGAGSPAGHSMRCLTGVRERYGMESAGA